MRSFGRSLSAVLAASLGAFTLVAVAPAVQAESGAAIRITEFAYSGRVARVGSGDGEYVELTNVGDAPADLTGWTYDNKTANAATGLSLSSLGTVAPGESVIVTDLTAADFRIEWGLKASVKVLSNAQTHTLDRGPNAIHVYDNGGAAVDSVSYKAGFEPAKGLAASVDMAHLGAKADTTGWAVVFQGDSEGSWVSGLGSLGSPGASRHGTLTPADVRTDGSGPEAPCDTGSADLEQGEGPRNPAPYSWPGSDTPATSDAQCAWVTPESGRGLSGLAFDPNDVNVLYAVKDTSHVYRLVRSGGSWVKDTANGWTNGKDLRFPGNTGRPDTEGIVVGPNGALYITTERDHAAPDVPLESVLKFDPTTAGATLVATDQWVLTPDLGLVDADAVADADRGLEGVAYVPDSFLTGERFKTDAETFYNPADYPSKVTAGLFLVAVAKTGHVLAYALNSNHSYTRVADIGTGMLGVMDLSFDSDLGRIWAHCDTLCANATVLLRVGLDGHIAFDRYYHRPAYLPSLDFDGFAVAPVSTATDGTRQLLLADDGNRFGHSLWNGTLDVNMRLEQVSAPLPVIGGTPIVGGTLTAKIGTWGVGVTTHYRWKVGNTVLGVDQPLPLTDPTLAGKTVTLAVTGTRSFFADATMTASTTITDGALTTHVPKVGGTVAIGKTLTASVAPWGPMGVTLSYQWLAGDQPIEGATGTALLLTSAMLGTAISFQVTGAKAGYGTDSTQSNPTVPVKAGVIAARRPTIRGRAEVGRRLTVRPGAWSADGTVVGYQYQWYVDGKAVRGATKARLRVTRAYRGMRIKVQVTGYAVDYATVSRISAVTARVK